MHLNMWVPGSDWTYAYDPNLQWTASSTQDQTYTMSVDSVNIQTIAPSPVSAQWTNSTGDNSWATINNWSPTSTMNLPGDVANFSTLGAGVVNINGSETVGKINLSSPFPSYTFNQGSSGNLTINDTGDTTVSPQINVLSGSHIFNVPMNLVNGLSINFSSSSGLAINKPITGAGLITVNGSSTLAIGTTTGILNSTNSLDLVANARVVLSPVINLLNVTTQSINSFINDGTGRLDIGNNILNIGSTTLAAVEAQIVSGYNNDTWTGSHGILSSVAQADSHHGIGYTSTGTSSVQLRYALYGDTNLDGVVNYTDLLTLAQHYGQSGQTWATGDFNYDGKVDFSDLLTLAQNYGASLTPSVNNSTSASATSFNADWTLAQSGGSKIATTTATTPPVITTPPPKIVPPPPVKPVPSPKPINSKDTHH